MSARFVVVLEQEGSPLDASAAYDRETALEIFTRVLRVHAKAANVTFGPLVTPRATLKVISADDWSRDHT